MKKFALLTVPFLSMGVAALCADGYTDDVLAEQSNELVAQQPVQKPNVQKPTGQQPNGSQMPMREITPQVEPKVTHCADPFITAEFIYWKAYEENLHFAYTGAISTTNADAHEGRLKSPEFEWQPGFKLGFGLKFAHDGWDLYANWTWLNEFDGDNDVETEEDSVAHYALHSAFTPSPGVLSDITFDRASVEWNMEFNALDLELGRNFYISPFLTLRPHFGLKFGWIEQHYNVKAHDFSTLQGFGGAIPPSRGTNHTKQEFLGVGIRTGFDTVWYFAEHWGMYADFAFGALWSDFKTQRKDHISAISAFVVPNEQIAKVKNLNLKENFNTITEVLELGMGFRYDTTFFLGDYDFYIQAGWEEQIWFNQNQILDTVDSRTGNLTFQGLSVKAGLMF